jgi:hypothetical protein
VPIQWHMLMKQATTTCWVATGLLLALMVLAGGCTANQGNPLASALDAVRPPSPGEAARDAFNVHDPDRRRRSISLLASSDFGGEEPYVRMYRMLVDDPDATVRAAAAHALGMHGDVEDGAVLARLLDDAMPAVRWEAAKALQRIHDPVAINALIRASRQDSDADVRMAAAAALGQYANPSVFQALVAALGDRSFGVVNAAHESLKTLTGYDFSTDGSLWLIFADRNVGNLFQHQQQYVYRPYDKPRTLLDRARFWRHHEPTQPRVPVGMDDRSDRPRS